MTTLFQDPVIGQPDASSVLQAPGQSAPGLGISSPNVAQDAMQARVKAMPVDQRIFSGLGEVGAALKGDPSPMALQDQQQQTLKMNNFKLLNETMGALQQGLTLIQGTSGEDRKRLATAYASKLDSTEPGMGQVFSALSDKPGMLDMLKQNAHLLPQSWQMEIVSDPQSALKRLGTPEGQATFNAAMEVPQIDNATQRGMFLLGHWQQLVSPELAKEIGNPTNLSTGDLVKINNAVKENPQYAKLAIPDDALRVALTHDAFASSLHLMDAKGTQDVMKKRAEAGTWSAPYELNGAQVQKNDATGEIRTAVSRVPVTNVSITQAAPASAKGLSGADFLSQLDPATAGTVRSISEGRVPITSISMRNGERGKMLNLVNQYNPTFEASKQPVRQALSKDFTSGTTSNNVTAINTAIAHMGTLSDLGTALKNNDIQGLNRLFNAIGAQTGHANVTNYDVAASALSNELMRVFRQVGASEVETKAWEDKYGHSLAPDQIQGALQTGAKLLEGRIRALDDKWNRGMEVDTGYPNLLSPRASEVIGRFGVTRTPSGDDATKNQNPSGGMPDMSAIDAEIARRPHLK